MGPTFYFFNITRPNCKLSINSSYLARKSYARELQSDKKKKKKKKKNWDVPIRIPLDSFPSMQEKDDGKDDTNNIPHGPSMEIFFFFFNQQNILHLLLIILLNVSQFTKLNMQ